MPEDEGVNGDRWTNEASVLLRELGWQKVADSNIDIPGTNGLMHGIDAMFKYEDGFVSGKRQGIFVEAKRYATTSFNPAKIRDWVAKLDEKIQELVGSESFYTKYPGMDTTDARNGLLVLWFHDTENYPKNISLSDALLSVRTPRGRVGVRTNRLFVMDNEDVLRLASLKTAITAWNTTHNTVKDQDFSVKFYYPSSPGFSHPTQKLPGLNLEYMYSKFILAKAQELRMGAIRPVNLVFYFGNLKMASFETLRKALLSFNMLERDHKLYLYLYQRDDDEFRKIKPDALDLFRDNDATEAEFKHMDRSSDLPAWIKDVLEQDK